MKRYYICKPEHWPHPLPDADGKFEDRPFVKDDPRLLIVESFYIDLGSLGGEPVFLVVIPHERSVVPKTWVMLPHLQFGGQMTQAHIDAIGKPKRKDDGRDLSPQVGDTTYSFIRRVVDTIKDDPDPSLHHPLDPEQW